MVTNRCDCSNSPFDGMAICRNNAGRNNKPGNRPADDRAECVDSNLKFYMYLLLNSIFFHPFCVRFFFLECGDDLPAF